MAAEQGATPEQVLEDVVDRYLKYVKEMAAAVHEAKSRQRATGGCLTKRCLNA
jgi:hypothetical protein